MQQAFSLIPRALDALELCLAPPRLKRYLLVTEGDKQRAINLYRWNTLLSQSLWWPLQTLEIVSRNAFARVLVDRYGSQWPYSDRLKNILSNGDRETLLDSIDRQIRDRATAHPPPDAIVADLPFGFWTSLLTNRYNVPFGWPTRLRTAFPALPAGLVLISVSRPMSDVRILRNRIAHHEPIFHKKPDASYHEIMNLIGWLSPEARWYVTQSCNFTEIFALAPSWRMPAPPQPPRKTKAGNLNECTARFLCLTL
jgi:hypothetical protein